MDYKHEVIMCIVNAGYTDVVMETARQFGARGGTVIHARGTANPEAENKFGITVQPEKELVMILVKKTIRDDILHALYNAVGPKTGQGIAFCLPVEDVVGLKTKNLDAAVAEVLQNAKADAPEKANGKANEAAESKREDAQ